MAAAKNSFQFVNYSGTYQIRMETAEDLLAIPMLDEQFWMATSAPTYQLDCDRKLLEFLDQDGDGRILSGDVRRALAWMRERLGNLEGVSVGSDILRLADVRSDTVGGRAVLVTIARVLQNLGKENSVSISLAETRNQYSRKGEGFFGGAGIIPIEEVADEEMRAFLKDMSVAVGFAPTPEGKPGIDSARLETFIKSARDFLAWRKSAREGGEKLFPLGDETPSGYALFDKLRPVINRYFSLCSLVIQNRIMQRPTPETPCPDDIIEDSGLIQAFLERDALARPSAENILNLRGEINPSYEDDLKQLECAVLQPLLGHEGYDARLGVREWVLIQSVFAPYENWLKAKSGSEAEKIGVQKLSDYLEGNLPDRVRTLIEKDIRIGSDLSAARDLEYLIVLQAGFLEFCNNFVNFHNFYDPQCAAMFEAGRLVMNGRIFNFNMPVMDPDSHSKAAVNSGMFLLYSEITGLTGGDKRFIATPVTALTTRGLGVNKRGVLFDRAGGEWDARVIKIVENPVSIRHAVAQPFVRIGRVISNSFEKIISGTEKTLETGVAGGIGRMGSSLNEAASASPGQAAPKQSSAREWVFTGSVAVAALGSSLAFILKTLSGFNWSSLFTTLLAGLCVLMIPLILVAEFRLSRRNLGGLLEASGWAINSEMRLSRSLAKILSPEPRHPAGFILIRKDRTVLFLRKLRAALKGGERKAK
jgi:hypothetical protein